MNQSCPLLTLAPQLPSPDQTRLVEICNTHRANLTLKQACKLKFKLRELTSCLGSAAALTVCFEFRVAGLDATETGNGVFSHLFRGQYGFSLTKVGLIMTGAETVR